MRSILLIILTALAFGSASGANFGEWPTGSVAAIGVLDERIDKMLHRIERQREQQTEIDLLRSIFRRTQKEFLHRYKPYAELDELLSGEFDCLTATSLFAAVLTRAGYSFRIVETNYHIFLIVATTSGEVLLETTDRFGGVVTTKDEIAKKIEAYKVQAPVVTANQTAYLFDFHIYGEIEAGQLTGLLYFNQAVKAYNEGDWMSCSEKIVMADKHYRSPRVAALASVLLYTISIGELPELVKQSIQSNLKTFDLSGLTTASR